MIKCSRFAVLAGLAVVMQPVTADVLLLATQGTMFYRVMYQGDRSISQTFDLATPLIGMTRVPVGASIFDRNSGALIAVEDVAANQSVFRISGVATGAPRLERIGTLVEPTFSPVFVGSRLFGVFTQSGTVWIREYNPSNGTTRSEWNTRVSGGSGGMAYRPLDNSIYFLSEVGLWKIHLSQLGQPAVQVGTNFPVPLNKMGLDAFGQPERATLFIAAQTRANNPGSFFLARVDWDTGAIESPHIADFSRRLDIAVVSTAAIPCGADFNEDDFIDFFDYDLYVQCFQDQVCPPGKNADIDEDEFVDFFDYAAFVTAFESGC